MSKSLGPAGGGDPNASGDSLRRDAGVDTSESPSVSMSFKVSDISAKWSIIMSSFSINRGSKAANSGWEGIVSPFNAIIKISYRQILKLTFSTISLCPRLGNFGRLGNDLLYCPPSHFRRYSWMASFRS